MPKLYMWCPSCNKEESVNDREPKVEYSGTDGHGQPVRYSKCDCGKVYGWFNIGFYRWEDGFEFNESFKSYLKYRIELYHR